MKRVLCLLVVLSLLLSILIIPVSALELCDQMDSVIVSRLVRRAGGGSSGGGGGGGGSSGGSGGHFHGSNPNRSDDPISMLVGLFIFLLMGSGATLAFRLRLSKSARNTKRLMALLEKKDSAWKYKHLQHDEEHHTLVPFFQVRNLFL